MKKPKISVIIRTKNEEKTVGRLLKNLRQQTFQDFETIIVDNESTDETLEVVRNFNVDKIITIADKDFTHGRSLNLGIRNSNGELIVLTNGHCVPTSKTWLADGIKNFHDPKVAAIDGHYTAGETATKWQKTHDKKYKPFLKTRREGGPITNTNSIVRKDLWRIYPFDETLPSCEDYDWSQEMIARGYKLIKDPAFNIYHLHPLTKEQNLEREKFWRKTRRIIDRRTRPFQTSKNQSLPVDQKTVSR